jgi:hypothetical protein
MMTRTVACLAVAVFATITTGCVSDDLGDACVATASVAGTVHADGEPVAGVTVAVLGSGRGAWATTDEAGTFSIDVRRVAPDAACEPDAFDPYRWSEMLTVSGPGIVQDNLEVILTGSERLDLQSVPVRRITDGQPPAVLDCDFGPGGTSAYLLFSEPVVSATLEEVQAVCSHGGDPAVADLILVRDRNEAVVSAEFTCHEWELFTECDRLGCWDERRLVEREALSITVTLAGVTDLAGNSTRTTWACVR